MFGVSLNLLRIREGHSIPILVTLIFKQLKKNNVDNIIISDTNKYMLSLNKLIKDLKNSKRIEFSDQSPELCLGVLRHFIKNIPIESLIHDDYFNSYLVYASREISKRPSRFFEDLYPPPLKDFANLFYNGHPNIEYHYSEPNEIRLKTYNKLKDLTFGLLNTSKSRKILSIDGGGMRGLFAIKMLDFIITKLYGGNGITETQKFIKQFDMIAGTSVGSIISMGMILGHSIKDLRKMFYELGTKVFDNSWISFPGNIYNYLKSGDYYSSKILTDLIKKLYGDTTMNEIPFKVFAVATAATNDPYEVYLFRSYNVVGSPYEGTKDISIDNAVKASTSAPSYFEPYVDPNGNKFYDGGLMANNPTETAIFELYHTYPDDTVGMILSIGTGRPKPQPTNSSIINITNNIVNIATNSELTHLRILEWITEYAKDINYFRFSPDELGSIRLDTNNIHTLENGEILTERYMNSQIAQIEKLKIFLL